MALLASLAFDCLIGSLYFSIAISVFNLSVKLTPNLVRSVGDPHFHTLGNSNTWTPIATKIKLGDGFYLSYSPI